MSISFTCQCGRTYTVSDHLAGNAGRCRSCGATIRVPMPEPQESQAATPSADNTTGAQGVCGYCLTTIDPLQGLEICACPGCGRTYHKECWNENGGCGVYGCSYVPRTEPRDALEIPASYWGADQKSCPACGATIQAAAIRCRTCGAVLQSSRPENASEFQARQELGLRIPELRRGVILLLVFSVLTCSAPIAAIVGGSWYASGRDSIKKIPGPYPGLFLIALAIAVMQTAVFLLMAFLYAATRGG